MSKVTKSSLFLLVFVFLLFVLAGLTVGDEAVKNTMKETVKSLVKGTTANKANDNSGSEINGTIKYEEIFADTIPPPGWFTVNEDGSPAPDTTWEYYEGINFTSGDSVRPQAGVAFWANNFNNANGTIIQDWLITPRLPVIESGDSLYVWVTAISLTYPDTLTIWVSLLDSLVSSFGFPVDTIIDPGPTGEWHRYAMDITVDDLIVGYEPFVGFKHDHRNGGPTGSGSNWVCLDHVILANGGLATSIGNSPNSTPSGFVLQQNYPNPFNPSTTIAYQLAKDSEVSLTVYNLAGQEIRTLVNKRQSAGPQQVVWDGKDLHGNQVASGIYLYRLKTENNIQTRKMILMK
jgi:hypothetical protein